MASKDDKNNARTCSPRALFPNVTRRGPLTRLKKAALLNEELSPNNPSPNGSEDEAPNPHGVPTKATHTTPSRSGQKTPVPPATTKVAENRGTVNGSSSERPDVPHDDDVNVLKNKNQEQTTLRNRAANLKKKETTRTSTSNKRGTESSSGSFIWRVMGWSLLLVGTAVISFLIMSSREGKMNLFRAVKLEQFHQRFTTLESSFPHQRDQLWRRSKIHLEKHLKTNEPTEPVSLIFAAGRGAEKTLQCLALGVASSYSSAFNASVLSIDGAGQAGYDSDEVKLDIDKQLQAAFEGEKPAVVIHRLEELPPSSTVIFYRYCDHESAAYKKVFLLFTVLLPRDEITSDQSLKEVEELVQDHLVQKLLSSSPADLNKMNADIFSGLWSRISHLILPVGSEETMEKRGCEW